MLQKFLMLTSQRLMTLEISMAMTTPVIIETKLTVVLATQFHSLKLWKLD
jgi:hypothetical protein